MSRLLGTGLLAIPLLGGLAGAGLALLVWTLVPRPPRPGDGARSAAGAGRRSRWRRRLYDLRRRGPLAALAAVLALVVTRWPVAAVAAAALVLAWPALFGGAKAERRATAMVQALAVWTESLRDTIAGAVGLEQAVVASSAAPPAALAAELASLADRLRVRTPLPTALRRFADDLADPSADLIIAALVLNAGLRGPGLRDVLGSLADSARSEVDMRSRVAAGRASTRRSVQIVVGVTVAFVGGLTVFNPAYVEPYRTALGQGVLAVVVLLFAGGFFWLRRLSQFDVPDRLLRSGSPVPADGLRGGVR
jgi:Flp pilus assembly protein TadB